MRDEPKESLRRRLGSTLTSQGWVVQQLTLTLRTHGEPGGVGDCDDIVSRLLLILAAAPETADCFNVKWTVFVIVEPVSWNTTV